MGYTVALTQYPAITIAVPVCRTKGRHGISLYRLDKPHVLCSTAMMHAAAHYPEPKSRQHYYEPIPKPRHATTTLHLFPGSRLVTWRDKTAYERQLKANAERPPEQRWVF